MLPGDFRVRGPWGEVGAVACLLGILPFPATLLCASVSGLVCLALFLDGE